MKIKIISGKVSEGDARESHLIQNHLLDPDKNIDKLVMYAEKRYLMTLLSSGARDSKYTMAGYTPVGGDTVRTRIKEIPEGELINGNAWAYRIMGRIQKASEILGTSTVGLPTVGTTAQGGQFKLYLKDNYMTMGMNCYFPNGKMARVMSLPIGSFDKYLYTFQCYPGDTFNWTTWIGGVSGVKTVFGGFTTYGERSRRGYGNFHYPDKYLQHTTKQRKSISLSGDVNANEVRWYEYGGERGFVYEAEAQTRAQFLLEDEDRLWNGISTMRDQYGNLLTAPAMHDENGEPIVAGDGWIQQVQGSNDMQTSGPNGTITFNDMVDMVRQLKKGRNQIEGNTYIVVCGVDGLMNAEAAVLAHGINAINLYQEPGDKRNDVVGGVMNTLGYKFRHVNILGEQLIFIENPLQDDEQRYPARMSNGEMRKSNTYYFMDFEPDLQNGINNIEIRARGRAGVNRNIVYCWKNGMTGEGIPDGPVDSKEFHMLKETMCVIRNTKTQGILSPSINA